MARNNQNNKKKNKDRIFNALLFAVPGLLFFISGVRFYFHNDTVGMLINYFAGASFLVISYSRLKGWFA